MFGGQGEYEAGSRIYTVWFTNGESFAESLDALRESGGVTTASEPISCNTGALWLSTESISKTNVSIGIEKPKEQILKYF